MMGDILSLVSTHLNVRCSVKCSLVIDEILKNVITFFFFVQMRIHVASIEVLF